VTKIVKAFPPNYEEIRARFNPPAGTVFAYGDTIYAPYLRNPLPQHLIVHESTHFAQQRAAGSPEAWWRRYIDDPQFRLEQELEAYRAQYAAVAALSRPERRELLAHICRSLASRMYGGIVTKEQARALVTGSVTAAA
jgi:hypothetical protein